MRAVEVIWRDSMFFDRGWDTQAAYVEDATEHGMEHCTVGYLFHETELMVLLAQNRERHDVRETGPLVSNVTAIPKTAIISIIPSRDVVEQAEQRLEAPE